MRLRKTMVLMLSLGLSGCNPPSKVVDETTGMGVDAPAPFVPEILKGLPGTTAITLTSKVGKPSPANASGLRCMLFQHGAPVRKDRTQTEVSTLVSSDQWRADQRKRVTSIGKIQAEIPFSQKDMQGVEFHYVKRLSEALNGPGSANRFNEAWRIWVSYFETAKGPAFLECSVATPELDEAIKHFRAIRSAVILPKYKA